MTYLHIVQLSQYWETEPWCMNNNSKHLNTINTSSSCQCFAFQTFLVFGIVAVIILIENLNLTLVEKKSNQRTRRVESWTLILQFHYISPFQMFPPCEEESMQNSDVFLLYLSDCREDDREQWTHSLTWWTIGQDCCC